jgi:hypothetical protein
MLTNAQRADLVNQFRSPDRARHRLAAVAVQNGASTVAQVEADIEARS